MHWLGARHDLIVVDAPERMPQVLLGRALDASAALARVGLPARIDWPTAERWTPFLGPVVVAFDERRRPRCLELRVPLPDALRERYQSAWHRFLAAFDRFAAARPNAGFGTFVEQARQDQAQRPALHAWHEALRLAAWHEHKAGVVAELLERHRRERVLVFTPDRRSAYEIAGKWLVPAITAEIPLAERARLLDAFATGSLHALAGPRLLETGIPAGTADVAILVGGGYGRDQRDTRCGRVAETGVVYELVTWDTVEVGRARRWRGAAAEAAVVVHRR
jgi:superfamily II DNA or RNA helicase